MHVVVPDGASTCRSKSPKGEWVEKVYDCVISCYILKGKILKMKVLEDFESMPHKAVSFVVERGKETRRMERGETAEGATSLQWRKLARKEHKRERRRRRGGGRWWRKHKYDGQNRQRSVVGIQVK